MIGALSLSLFQKSGRKKCWQRFHIPNKLEKTTNRRQTRRKLITAQERRIQKAFISSSGGLSLSVSRCSAICKRWPPSDSRVGASDALSPSCASCHCSPRSTSRQTRMDVSLCSCSFKKAPRSCSFFISAVLATRAFSPGEQRASLKACTTPLGCAGKNILTKTRDVPTSTIL